MSAFFERIVRLSLRHAGRVMLGATLIAALFAAVATQLAFHASYDELLPADAVEVRDLEVVSKKAGSAWYVIVAIDRRSVEAEDPDQALQKAKAWAEALAPKLEALPLVDHAEFRLPLEFLEQRRLLFLDTAELRELTEKVRDRIERAKIEASPFDLELEEERAEPPSLTELEEEARTREVPLSEHHLDRNGRYLYLLLKPTVPATDMAQSRRLFAALDTVIAAHRERSADHLVTRYAGAHFVHLAENDAIEADLGRGSLLALVLSCLVVLGFTRRPRTLVVVLLPLVYGLCVTFGLAQLLIAHVNILTGFLVGILLGIGVDFGIHMFVRYVQLRDGGQPLESSVVEAALHTGRASLTSALTTAAAFLALTFADFPGFSEFGLIASVGVMVAFGSTFLLFPAVTALFERRWPLGSGRPRTRVVSATVPRGVAWAVCLVAVALTALGAVASPRVGFEIDLDVVRGESEAFTFDRYVEASQELRTTPSLVLVEGHEDAARVEAIVEQVKAEQGERSGIDRVLSEASLVPPNQGARLEVIAELRELVDDPALDRLDGEERRTLERVRRWAAVHAFGANDLPLAFRRRLQTRDGEGRFVLVFGDQDEASIDAAMDWASAMKRVRELAAADGIDLHILSGTLISGRLFRAVIDEGPFVLWATLLAVFAVLLLDLRSLPLAALVMLPVVCALFIISGVMVLVGMKLNFINATIFPCIVGIAVDDTVHMLHRYRSLGPGNIPCVLRQTGTAAVLASVTTAAGFGSMMVAHHYGLFSLGLLAVISITVVLFTSVVFFGALLRLGERV